MDVQVQVTAGLPAFSVVGLPDKAVAESRERVRGAFAAMGLALPPKRVVVNLAPADLPKEGSHYDLPIALGVLAALGVVPEDAVAGAIALGELALDGAINRVAGVLSAAIAAVAQERDLICPAATGPEAAWAGDGLTILAAPHLLALVNHFRGTEVLGRPLPGEVTEGSSHPDLRDIKGQETAKRVLEIAAAGNHNLLFAGPPGAGKSMLARRMAGLLPPLDPAEALEVTMIASLAGEVANGRLSRARPFRAPHHSASMPALIGGGIRVKPGEVSLAHLGILFLDELPEFSRQALDSLRQPLETGTATVARANSHVQYPARIQLVAAMNPCRCGWFGDPTLGCGRAPKCGRDYQSRISGPLLDRIDLALDIPAVSLEELRADAQGESNETVAARVATARDLQRRRAAKHGQAKIRSNAEADGEFLTAIATPDDAGRQLLDDAAEKLRLTARGYHRVLRVARTLADLGGRDEIGRLHVAEALSYRRGALSLPE